jgi:hypothetical protein
MENSKIFSMLTKIQLSGIKGSDIVLLMSQSFKTSIANEKFDFY